MASQNTSDLRFTKGVLHHTLCGIIHELELHVSKHVDTPRPVKLDVSILEGTVGKIKRAVQITGSTRIRDWCIRAKVCSSEVHLNVLGTVSYHEERLILKTVSENIESIQERKARLGAMKFAYLMEKKAKRERQQERVRRRAQMIERIPIRFDCDDSWARKLLVEQAERRKISYARVNRKEELIKQIEDHDAQLDATTLCEHLQTRGLHHASTARPAVLLKRLAKYDQTQQHPEAVRDEMQQREEASKEQKGGETERETEDESSEEEEIRKRKRGA